MLLKVNIAGLTIDPATNTPIVILKSENEKQIIPIWIGLLEATSIASALQDIKFDRPMTHDLFKNFTDILEIDVSKIEVCDLIDNTFYAKIYFLSKDKTFSMDARPSDAIALAIRYKAPIYVEDKVIAGSNMGDKDAEILDKSEEGKKWADYLEKLSPDYLEKLSPDDFGKYKV